MLSPRATLSLLKFEVERLQRKHRPADDRRRRITDALARHYVVEGERVKFDTRMVVACRSLIPYLARVDDPDSSRWPMWYATRYPSCVTPIRQVTRRNILRRIRQGNLGIEDRLGVWDGGFWRGLTISGALRQGPGTEIYIWEAAHAALIADLAQMPVFGRLEPKRSKSGLRRLRRCYASLLPANDRMGVSVLAGLFAGATFRDEEDGTWMELPNTDAVRDVLDEWGIPARACKRHNRDRLEISPLFGSLLSRRMPPHSAQRFRDIRKAGGCPYLSVALYEMVLSTKHRRYMFPDALPFGISKATFFRMGWHRRDLHRAAWLDLGIRIKPGLRDLLVDWYRRRSDERMAKAAARADD